MQKTLLAGLVIATIALGTHFAGAATVATDEDDDEDSVTIDEPCLMNADGKPGLNFWGGKGGNGGAAGTINLNGKLPDGCASANGGNGGSFSASGNGGKGGTINY